MIHDRPPSYRFGCYVLDMARRQLSREGEAVPLRPKDLEVLWVLVTNSDRAVSKQELLTHVWPGTVVDENNLPRHISTLRKILTDEAGSSRYIETVPGWGYRFTCTVERLNDGGLPPTPSVTPAADARVSAQSAIERAGDASVLQIRSRQSWVRWSAALAAASTAVIVGIGGWRFATVAARPTPAPLRTLRQVTYEPGQQQGPAWSPDGSTLAFTSDQSGNLDIYIQSLSSSRLSKVTSSEDHDWQPAWSPDGRRLAFRSERNGGGIYIVRSDGTGEHRIVDFGYQPRWSRDGSSILISTGLDNQGEASKLLLVRPDEGAAVPFVPAVLAPFRSVAANWHPDGTHISIWAQHPQTGRTFMTVRIDDGSVVTSRIASDVSERIDALSLTLTRFVWAPSGRFLYFEGTAQSVRSLWRIGIDPANQSWMSGPDRLTTGAGQDTDLSISPDGTKLAFGILSARKRLWSFPFDLTTGTIRDTGGPVELDAEEPMNASLTRDGHTLVYRTMRAGRPEIRERSLDDGREQVVLAGMSTTPPHLSNDGRRLAYARTTSGTGNIITASVFVLPTTGGEEVPIARLDNNTRWAITDWAPDGNSLLGTCQEATPNALRRLCLMPISAAPDAEKHLEVLAADSKRNLFVPRFSPDMRWISFIASDAGRSTVYIMPAGGGPWIQLTDGRFQNDKLRWAPDSRAVYFVSNRTGFLNVWRRQIAADGQPIGSVTQVTAFNSAKRMIPSSLGGMEFAVTDDKLVVPLAEASSRIWLLEDVDK